MGVQVTCTQCPDQESCIRASRFRNWWMGLRLQTEPSAVEVHLTFSDIVERWNLEYAFALEGHAFEIFVSAG